MYIYMYIRIPLGDPRNGRASHAPQMQEAGHLVLAFHTLPYSFAYTLHADSGTFVRGLAVCIESRYQQIFNLGSWR